MKRLVLLFAIILCLAPLLQAANFTSITSGLWNKQANWTGGGSFYPGQKNTNDNAAIDGEAMTLAIALPYQIASLTVTAGSLTMNSGANIISNVLTISGGSVTVNAGATLTLTSFNATNGTLTVNAGGVLIIKGTGTLASTFTLVNNGTITLDGSGGGSFITSNLSTFTNAGQLNINVVSVTESSSQFLATGAFTNTGVVTVHNGTLKVDGILTNSGAIVIKSTYDYTGMLIHNTPNVNATIERHIEGDWSNPYSGWHFLSSPVLDQNIYEILGPPYVANFVKTGLNGGFTYQDFYSWSEPTSTWINSIDGYGNQTTGFESQFIEYKGYLVSYNIGHQPNPRIFKGIVNTVSMTLNSSTAPALTRSGSGSYTGWNLLGNPFSSPIKWNDGNWALTNIAGTAKIWNGLGQSYSDVYANTGIIPVMQGFMVYVSNASGVSLTIPAASRTTVNANWMKETTNPMLKLVAHSLENSSFQESTIIFNPMATPGYDNDFDSYFLSGYAPMLYSSIGNDQYLSTNSLPFSEPLQASVNMGFIRYQGNEYTIEAEKIESFPQWTAITLEDKKTGQLHDLTLNPVYYFISEENDDAERFVIHFNAPGVGLENKEMYKKNPFTIYSSGNSVYVSPPNGTAEYSIVISDLLGRNMMNTQVFSPGIHQSDVNLGKGIYVVTILCEGSCYSSKVFIGR